MSLECTRNIRLLATIDFSRTKLSECIFIGGAAHSAFNKVLHRSDLLSERKLRASEPLPTHGATTTRQSVSYHRLNIRDINDRFGAGAGA